MDFYDFYDYYDLAAFTGRQDDGNDLGNIGIDILHTIGQLLAAFGPFFCRSDRWWSYDFRGYRGNWGS